MSEIVTLEQIAERIRAFIFENYLFGYDAGAFGDDASFLEFGVLDSLGIMELIAFVEKEFSVEVADAEIVPDNLDSVCCAARYVFEKTRAIKTGGASR